MSEYRTLNIQLRCKPYPGPKTIEILFGLEYFESNMPLILNVGYYNVQLSEYTIVWDAITSVYPSLQLFHDKFEIHT